MSKSLSITLTLLMLLAAAPLLGACHTMAGGDVPSSVGPELADMKTRFPNRADLVAVVSNEQVRNPQTVMPPFLKNHLLTAAEIEKIVDFLTSL